MAYTFSAAQGGKIGDSLLEEDWKGYALEMIDKAKAKGVKSHALMLKHALRNALIPIITVIAQSFVSLIAGALVTETVFNIPGVGKLMIDSIGRRDYEVVQAMVLLIAVLNVLVMFLLDILYGMIDPRIRSER